MLILVWANVAYSKDSDCNWNDDIPCITIYPNINNSNALGDKITPTHTIKKSEICFFLYSLGSNPNFK